MNLLMFQPSVAWDVFVGYEVHGVGNTWRLTFELYRSGWYGTNTSGTGLFDVRKFAVYVYVPTCLHNGPLHMNCCNTTGVTNEGNQWQRNLPCELADV